MKVRELLANATPRPWRIGSWGIGAAAGIRHENAALIVAAVNEYEALLDVAEAAWRIDPRLDGNACACLGPPGRCPCIVSFDQAKDSLRVALARLDAVRSDA